MKKAQINMVPSDLKFVLHGASLLADGIEYYPDWSAQMLNKFDEDIRAELPVFHEAARELIRYPRDEWDSRGQMLVEGKNASGASGRGTFSEAARGRAAGFMERSLPAPLGDPLRGFRTFIAWMMGLGIVVILVMVPWARTTAVVAQAFLLVMMLLLWSILPHRVTNALYLRSFRKDPRTKRLRRVAQAALGSDFRMSGVRDPQRRWPGFFRIVWNTIFLFQYNSPRFMNLEARADWFSRLWRSFEHARCVLIDVSDITDTVLDEIGLCFFALGLERILFIGDVSRSENEWRKCLTGWLPADNCRAVCALPAHN